MITPVSSATVAPLRVLFASAPPIAPVAPVSRESGRTQNSAAPSAPSIEIAPGLDLTPATDPGVSIAAQEGAADSSADDQGEAQNASSSGEERLTEEEQAQVAKLKARDREVRTHEQAHAAAGGAAAGAPSYSYQQGPDGRQYAVGGEVPIKASASSSDPQAAIRQLEQVVRAALAPAQPSGQDRAVAAGAQAQIAQLRAQAAQESQAKAKESLNPDAGESAATGDAAGATEGQPLLPELPKFEGAGATGGGSGSASGSALSGPLAAYQQAGGDGAKKSGASGQLLSLFA